MMKWTFPLVLIPLLSSADVNMRDASFLKKENDFKNPWTARTYNSRSLWVGTFGFGWCAEFEKSLELKTSSQALLKFCDRSKMIQFQSSKDEKVWVDEKKIRHVFDSTGRLIRIEKPKQKPDRFTYLPSGKINEIRSGSGKLVFHYDPESGNLNEIQDGRKKTKYMIQFGDLVSVQNSLGMKTRYDYDHVHNLIEINSSGKTEKIIYQTELDEVRSTFQSNGCYDLFQFQKVSDLQYKSLVHKRCPSSRPSTQIFSFTSKRTPQGGLTLLQVKTAGGSNDSSILP